MEKIILFGAVKNITSVFEFIEKMNRFEIIEIWDNYFPKRYVYYRGRKTRVTLPYKIDDDIPIVIIPDRYEIEIRQQLIEMGIKSENIKSYGYFFHYIKTEIINRYSNKDDVQIREIIKYLKSNDLNVYNGGLFESYKDKAEEIEIFTDDKCELLYSYWNGKKIYLKRGMSKNGAKKYFNFLRMEQDSNSPHCYEQLGPIGRSDDVIIDAGAAEGFFSLERIDNAKHIYLIECDKSWIEALKNTFADYREKVTIIPKYLSDFDDDEHVKIDTIDNIGLPITAIKMDIEGGEIDAIKGGKNLFSQNRNIDVAACVYHKTEDGRELSNNLLEYHFEVGFTNGYMFFPYEENIKPELRHGVVIGRKKKTYNVYVWGMGKYYQKARRAIKSNCVIKGFLDCNDKLFDKTSETRIMNPEILKYASFDYVLVSIIDYNSIKEIYHSYDLPIEKMICLWEDVDDRYNDFLDCNILRMIKHEYYLNKYEKRLKNAPFEYAYQNSITIIDAEILLNDILEKRTSLARFGDGEFELMRMKSRPWFQDVDPILSVRLKEVLETDVESLCIAVADDFGNLDKYTDKAADAIRSYVTNNDTRTEVLGYLSVKNKYYDAYVSRPYIIYRDKGKAVRIFNMWKKIWQGRKVLLVEGMTSRMGWNNDLLDRVESIKRILCPERNAFSKYDEILEKIKENIEDDDLVLIKLGPTATVLAYDLAKLGYQAIDIGQLDNEYDWYRLGVAKQVGIKGKTVAEVISGRIPDVICENLDIEKEILCRIE